jgi:hypothetical protein
VNYANYESVVPCRPLTRRKKLNVSSMRRHNRISLLRRCRRIILGWDRIRMLRWGYNRVHRIWGLRGRCTLSRKIGIRWKVRRGLRERYRTRRDQRRRLLSLNDIAV